MVRWANLDNQEKAEQFSARGQERLARNDVRDNCTICENNIAGGDKYYDVNGIRFAHKSCVVSNSGSSNNGAKHGKVVTHKMMEAVSAKKAAADSTAKVAKKRGRKPKSTEAALKPATAKATKPAKRGRKPKAQKAAAMNTPSINLSEVREALPGAIVTLTITGTVEAVQRALDKLQN
jgi:hypothetical protein